MKILIEGIGSPVLGTQLKYFREISSDIVGIDISGMSFGFYEGIKPYIVPKYGCHNCFEKIEEVIKHEQIDMVFPSINEGLIDWSRRKDYFFKKYGTQVIISDPVVIEKCVDKWLTFLFFSENNIPTPKTSLVREYDLLKPRVGRGSQGILKTVHASTDFNMEGYISQEIVGGEEFTIDVLCDFNSKPIYIVPRRRLEVESGVSVKGITIEDKEIIEYSKRIVKALKPVGIINIQCFKKEGEINFIEINPRIAGGSSLSFAATDNWIRSIVKMCNGEKFSTKKIQFNTVMMRYYSEIIVDKEDIVI